MPKATLFKLDFFLTNLPVKLLYKIKGTGEKSTEIRIQGKKNKKKSVCAVHVCVWGGVNELNTIIPA